MLTWDIFPDFFSWGWLGRMLSLQMLVEITCPVQMCLCKLGVSLPFRNLWEMWLCFATGEIKSLKSHKTLCMQSNCLEFCRYLKDLPKQMRDRRWVKAPRLKIYKRWYKCAFFVDGKILKVNVLLSSVVNFLRPGRNVHSVGSTNQKSLNFFVWNVCNTGIF